MKLVIQRVSHAKVTTEGELLGEIGQGLMVLCGVMEGDTEEDARWLADKTAKLRIFTDAEDKLNLSVEDIGGGVLVVSNFTLGGGTAGKETARPLSPPQSIRFRRISMKGMSVCSVKKDFRSKREGSAHI